jgi:hypothetical protein
MKKILIEKIKNFFLDPPLLLSKIMNGFLAFCTPDHIYGIKTFDELPLSPLPDM